MNLINKQYFIDDKVKSEILTSLKNKQIDKIHNLEQQFDLDILEDWFLLYVFGTNSLLNKDFNKAKVLLKKGLSYNNKSVEILSNLGLVYEYQKEYEQAILYYKKAIEINNSHYSSRFNIGNIYFNLNKLKEAKIEYENLLKFYKTPPLLKNLSETCYALNELKTSFKYAKEFHNLNKHNIDSVNLITQILYRKNKFKKAIHFCELGKSIEKNNLTNLNTLGKILINLKNYDKAILQFKQILKIDNSFAEAYFNIAVCYEGLYEFEKAIKYHRKALKIKPELPEANFNLSTILLRNGNFSEGWAKYEYRFKIDEDKYIDHSISKETLMLPFWDPSKKNSKLFIWPEQGVGDFINFSSLLPEVKKICPNLTVAMDKRLLPIFKRSMPSIKFISKNDLVHQNAYDYQLPIGSLPKFFRNKVSDFNKTKNSFLYSNEKKDQIICDELNIKKHFTIGISWDSQSSNRNAKVLKLNEFANLFSKLPCKVVNLQYGAVEKEINQFNQQTGLNIIQSQTVDIYNDLDALASLINICDIVITIPNVTQTIACALGKKTFILLNGTSHFWWQNKTKNCIWHPQTSLYRKTIQESWDKVFYEINLDVLECLINNIVTKK